MRVDRVTVPFSTQKKTVVEISHSSLSVAALCPIKFWLQYHENLGARRGGGGVNRKMQFGSILHDVLPRWSLSGDLEETYAYLEQRWDIPEAQTDKYYNQERARSIVATYAHAYQDDSTGKDRFQIAHLQADKPLIEVEARLPLLISDDLEILYVGYLDRIVQDPDTGGLWIFDVKTTGMPIELEKSWARSQRNSEQFVGYAWMAHQLYSALTDLKIEGTIIDAIYTRNINITARNMLRFKVPRDLNKEKAFKYRVERLVCDLIAPIMLDESAPYGNAPVACGTYGGCQFLDVCDGTVDNYRSQIAENLFERREERNGEHQHGHTNGQ